MNGLTLALEEADRLAALVATSPPRADVALCPPATLLAAMGARLARTPIMTGGQDCHPATGGAHTGDIIVGHSERRADHGETDELVNRKALAGLGAGLLPIICVGETRAQREAGDAEAVVTAQLAGSVPDAADQAAIVIAYEPVWAIGTGLTPTSADIASMHQTIRDVLVARFGEHGQSLRILYGGSLKPANAKEILSIPHVNGPACRTPPNLISGTYALWPMC